MDGILYTELELNCYQKSMEIVGAIQILRTIKLKEDIFIR